MPTAEVVIEEGEYLNFSGSRAGASSGLRMRHRDGGGRKSNHKTPTSGDIGNHHHQQHRSNSAAAAAAAAAAGSGIHHPAARPKRFLSFPEGATTVEAHHSSASGAGRVPKGGGISGSDFREDDVSVVVSRSGAGSGANETSSSSNFLSSILPMVVPQFDFGVRFAGMPLSMPFAGMNPSHYRSSNSNASGAASRSGNNTPRPGPSSSSSSSHHLQQQRQQQQQQQQQQHNPADGEESAAGAERSGASSTASDVGVCRDSPSSTSRAVAASGFPFATSISLIESHVGVGFTLGSREKPYKCEQCGQCYKYLSAFTKHKEQNHTARLPGEKPFRCEICGMQFKYLKSFKKHRLNHAVERLHVYPGNVRSLAMPGSGAMTAGSLAGFMGVNMMEERSVLEMLARPQHHRREMSTASGSQAESRARLLHGAGGNMTSTNADGRRSSSPGDQRLSSRIKSEVEIVSSGDEQDNTMDDESTNDGRLMNQEEVVAAQNQQQFGSVAGRSSSAGHHVVHPHQGHHHHLSQQQQNRQLLMQHAKFTAASPAGSPASSFLQGAFQLQRQHQVAQHQAALMAANFLAARGAGSAAAAVAAAMPPPPGLERLQQQSAGLDPSTHGPGQSEEGQSDREGSDDGETSNKGGSGRRATPPTAPAGGGGPGPFLHNLIRDFSSAAAAAAAAAAIASTSRPSLVNSATSGVVGPSAAGMTGPPPEYDPGRPHLCPFCGKGFRAKENLKLHIRKHTGERPFECEFCGRAFGGKSDMNRHLRIHTGERPYRCDACGKTFARADYLSKHLSTHLV